MILGLTRASKGEEQNYTLQRKAPEEVMVERVFGEKTSAARWDRPELQRVMDQLR